MKQVLVHKGAVILEEVPPPAFSANEVLIQTYYSLISTGTELSGVTMSGESLLSRARKQPHNVKKAMKMVAEKGLLKTYKIIKGMLDFGTPTGYSLAGRVLAVGENVTDIRVGDLVAASGAGVANHAECVAVPRLLVSRIPDGLNLREAASVTLGAIAMQGVRQAGIKLGETVAVIGLGLIGQLTVQLVRASGGRVIGIDPDSGRRALAEKLGAFATLDPAAGLQAIKMSDGIGVDSTIITASTDSNAPLTQAMEITRKKGTVVVVGAVGLSLNRSPWYEKEIDLKISCSYGPGRYDASYEEEMLDYPLPYVRWTENRNMEEYLKLLAEKRVSFLSLSPEEFGIENAEAAYEKLKTEKPLALLLTYPEATRSIVDKKIFLTQHGATHKKEGRIGVAMIGAGGFAATTHLPNLEKLSKHFLLQAIVSKKGTTAKQFARQYGAAYCTTDYTEVLNDPNVDAVVIATRHNLHAPMALAALKAGKAVFVEKPLALTIEELTELHAFFEAHTGGQATTRPGAPILTVGYNRRFSPYAQEIFKRIEKRNNPLMVTYRVNAGFLPRDHWTQNTREGGGRIIGEGCHFLDLFAYWTGAQPRTVHVNAINPKTHDTLAQDNIAATITYSDGSVCTLIYTALGHRDLPKEYAEVFCDGRVYVLEDYKRLTVHGGSGSMRSATQDKGHREELIAFAEALKSGVPPIPLAQLWETSELSFEINRQITE